MKKTYKKIKRRFLEFKKNPLTEKTYFFALARYLFFNTFYKKKELKFNWIENLKLKIKKGDAGIVGNYYYGLYEFEESIFLLHFIEKDDYFLDIGANLGHFSLLLSGVKKCKSIAIEPLPDVYNNFVKLIKLNKLENLIEPLNIGLSNVESNLYFSTDKSTMNCIVDESYKNKLKIQVKTIDGIIKNEIPIAIKIDVEGYEKFVFDGAKKIMSNSNLKILIVELNNSGIKYGIDDDEIYKTISNYGFKPYSYNFKSKKLIELDGYNKHKFNTLFIRDISFVEKRLENELRIKILNKFY